MFVVACGLETSGFGASKGDSGIIVIPPSDDGGDAGPPPSEVCNGEDDNRNGIVDEGCPNCADVTDGLCKGALTFAPATPGPVLGVLGDDAGDGFFNESCAAAGVVVGAAGTESLGYTESLQVRCAPIALQRESGDVPRSGFEYRVVWTGEPYDTGIAHGASGFDTYRVQCDKPKVVVGMNAVRLDYSGNGNDGIARINLRCAELLVSGHAGAWTFSHGEVTTVSIGPESSNAPQESPAVPPQVWSGMTGQPPSNDGRRLRALGALTAKPALNLVPSAR